MPADDQEDQTIYRVVINHEEQYSIWPVNRTNPPGWTDCGVEGAKAVCLEYIQRVWTDMRPLSLRRRMAEATAMRAEPAPSPVDEPVEEPVEEEAPAIDPLVERLSTGSHPVAASRCSTIGAFQECVERGYLHMRFTETGTELGVRIDAAAQQRIGTEVARGAGTVRVESRLVLNDVPVRCVADIDLSSLAGSGRLEIVAEG
jgi:uncharacterized protein YbdZ (MbtH family)